MGEKTNVRRLAQTQWTKKTVKISHFIPIEPVCPFLLIVKDLIVVVSRNPLGMYIYIYMYFYSYRQNIIYMHV